MKDYKEFKINDIIIRFNSDINTISIHKGDKVESLQYCEKYEFLHTLKILSIIFDIDFVL